MTVYLGTHGEIELRRVFNGATLRSTIDVADVNATEKRFSFDFEHGQLVTGDQIEITSTNGSALTFIPGDTDGSVKKFIYVDELDGIRLYDSFAHAVTGGKTNAIALNTPTSSVPVEVIVESAAPRLLAQVNSFEINTERETVDTTVLSDEFRSRINTLISGSGRITAFWEYTGNSTQEVPMYLYELAHRTKVGSNFIGRFYIKKNGYNPSGVTERGDDEVWWRVEGIITAAAIQFSPNSTVQITADFITTGELRLRIKTEVPDALLQEDSGEIRLDQDSGAKLLLQQDL
tara:strand:+ start:327 stop:1196 length:870 start_codon:yes stop_codon:yes gene_type:complete